MDVADARADNLHLGVLVANALERADDSLNSPAHVRFDDEQQFLGLDDIALQVLDGGIASSSDGHYREEEVSSASWSLRIPITDQDYVNLVREFQTEELPHGVAPLIEMLRRVLGQKAISLRDEQAPNLMNELSALGN